MLSTSQRAPGYRFQYHVPPTPLPASNTRADKPSPRSLWSMYMPANPAPTMTASMAYEDTALREDLGEPQRDVRKCLQRNGRGAAHETLEIAIPCALRRAIHLDVLARAVDDPVLGNQRFRIEANLRR